MVISQRLFATRFESYLFPVRDFSLYVETLPVETPPKKVSKTTQTLVVRIELFR